MLIKRGVRMTLKTGDYILEVARIAKVALSNNDEKKWERIEITIVQKEGCSEITEGKYTIKEKEFDLLDRLNFNGEMLDGLFSGFKTLLVYNKSHRKRAWFSCEIIVEPSGYIKTKFYCNVEHRFLERVHLTTSDRTIRSC
jgi:hypothetical protein